VENVAKFPIRGGDRSEPASDRSASDLVSAIETLLSRCSLAERETVIRLLAEKIKPDSSSKAGDVLGTLLRILPGREQWTIGELKKIVSERGISASDKQVFNAVGHLTRKGHIKRIGYGRYVVEGIPIETTDDLGGEPTREEQHDSNY
jgi:hypothetical protein